MAPATLEAVLENLLDNAFQHGGAGVQVTLEARAARGGGALEIVVRDDGAGISPANSARVFDPFFTTARDRGGTGLGLTIVRALLRAHDATIALGAIARGTELVIDGPATQGGREMTLRKTDVLPLDDAAKAREKFRKAAAQPLVVFVTLGQGAGVEALVALADDYAGDEQDARRGLWAPRLADVRGERSPSCARRSPGCAPRSSRTARRPSCSRWRTRSAT